MATGFEAILARELVMAAFSARDSGVAAISRHITLMASRPESAAASELLSTTASGLGNAVVGRLDCWAAGMFGCWEASRLGRAGLT